MNLATLFGNIGTDPELQQAGSTSVLRFRLATSEKWKDQSGQLQERTDWHTIKVWGKRGEALARILSKGERVLVTGQIVTDEYEKDGVKRFTTEIKARNIELSGGSNPQDRRTYNDSRNNGGQQKDDWGGQF